MSRLRLSHILKSILLMLIIWIVGTSLHKTPEEKLEEAQEKESYSLEKYIDACIDTEAWQTAKTWKEYQEECNRLEYEYQENKRDTAILEGVPKDELPELNQELLKPVQESVQEEDDRTDEEIYGCTQPDGLYGKTIRRNCRNGTLYIYKEDGSVEKIEPSKDDSQ